MDLTPGMGMGLMDPRTQGLLGLSSALLQASGPSRTPVGLGQVAGQGLIGGLQGYQQGQQQAQQQYMLNRQLQQQQQQDAAKQEFLAKFPQLAPVLALDPKTALERAYPKTGDMFGKVDPKDYTPESVSAFSKSNNFADLVPVRKKEAVNLGGTTAFVDPYNTGSPLAHTMTPDAQANLGFKAFEFSNLSKNQREQLNNELTKIGISQQQLQEGRVQLVTDAEGNVHLVNKMTGVGTTATGSNGEPLKVSKPMTEVQGKANLFGSRADEADQVLRGLETKISTTGLAAKRGLENLPVIGGVMGAAGNAMLSGDQQKVEQAQRNFVNAVLRVESGAAISESEFRNAIKQYFPQPGDTPTVIEQKRSNRATAIAGLRAMGGHSVVTANPNANQPFVQPAQGKSAGPMTVNWSDLGR